MIIKRDFNSLYIKHKGVEFWSNGTITDKVVEYHVERMYQKYGGRPFKLKLPKIRIGKEIERYWDNDRNMWAEGFELFGLRFLKLILFNHPTKYTITTKELNKYDIKKHILVK